MNFFYDSAKISEDQMASAASTTTATPKSTPQNRTYLSVRQQRTIFLHYFGDETPPTQTALAKRYQVNRATISRFLKKMRMEVEKLRTQLPADTPLDYDQLVLLCIPDSHTRRKIKRTRTATRLTTALIDLLGKRLPKNLHDLNRVKGYVEYPRIFPDGIAEVEGVPRVGRSTFYKALRCLKAKMSEVKGPTPSTAEQATPGEIS